MAERIRSHATTKGTQNYAESAVGGKGANREHFREFQELMLSSLGIGTYLGEPDSYTDSLVEEAIFNSVSSGFVNVIDTAINYRFQKAERAVGRALKKLLESQIIKRDAFFVSTKNGYLTQDGDRPIDFWTYIHREFVKPGVLKPEDIAGDVHSMSLSFLRSQFERSLANLGLECLELMYLHNAAESWLNEIGLRRFLERLGAVFDYYEEERKKGRLLFYGLSTWTCFRVPKDHPEHLNLDEVVEIAKNSGGEDHGFRFIQLPFSISRTEALTLKNQRVADEPLTILDAAQRLGVGVFTSAPLNHGELLTSRNVPSLGEGPSKATSLLQFARSAHPSIVAPLIGQKQPKHVIENLAIAKLPPLQVEDFNRIYGPFLGRS
jgi:aryl-alcohol dehydrogenase-like predicted oxidoreductase